MRTVDRRTHVTRRLVLRGSTLAVPGAAAVMTITPRASWAQQAKNLNPSTMATLARVARDIFPHDRLVDAYYINAVAPYDGSAPELRTMLTSGCAGLDAEAKKRHSVAYLEVDAEADRVLMLQDIKDGPFFRKLHSDLVVSLYNQKPLWAKFGYEGSSADKGGYIHRGFNDIDWLGGNS